jgi:predicted transcriptional regulator
MSAGFADSLESFHDFVGAKIASGRTMSPEFALALWRERQRETAAIQEGIDALDRGDARPIDDFLRELDAEFGLDVQ